MNKSLATSVKMEDLKVWVAERPRDSSLCVDKIRKEIGIEPPSLGEGLRRMLLS